MKKLLTVLLVAGVLLGSVYAGHNNGCQESDIGFPSNDCDILDMRSDYLINVCGSIPVREYTMCASYRGNNNTDPNQFEPLMATTDLGNYDLQVDGRTGCFRFGLSDGNYFEDLTAQVVVICHSFENICQTPPACDERGTIASIPTDLIVDPDDTPADSNDGERVITDVDTWTKVIPQGPNPSSTIARFRICWNGCPYAIAGNYVAMVEVAYTVM